MNKKLTYLACPYSHPSLEKRIERFKQVNKAAVKLMEKGELVYSPISHTHPIALAGNLPTDWTYWRDYDRAFLEHSYKIVVLKLDGWDQSIGVAAELDIAKELGLDIEFLETKDLTNI